ncbi:MAG: response regulator transcription factor [Candidatus Polarisedimenticolia bacterium]
MPRVLIVEDDEAMAVALRDGFQYEGFEVLQARDGAAGLRLAQEKTVELVVLDVMLPKKSGLDVCKRIRADGNTVPIIMLTARGQEIDKVVGLKSGADDYVTKPFSFMELMARVHAVLRRARGGAGAQESFKFGNVAVDFRSCQVVKGRKPIDLTPREFQLLKFFIEHRGQVLTRDQLLDAVWGYESIPVTRTVDTHVAKLRRSLEDDPADPRHIVTVHRVGYRFNA